MLISRNLHKKSCEVSIKARSTPASLSFKGQVTKHTTVKWSIIPFVFTLRSSCVNASWSTTDLNKSGLKHREGNDRLICVYSFWCNMLSGGYNKIWHLLPWTSDLTIDLQCTSKIPTKSHYNGRKLQKSVNENTNTYFVDSDQKSDKGDLCFFGDFDAFSRTNTRNC